MIKTKIIETTEKFDENGRVVEKITREETSENDTIYYPNTIPTTPTKVTEVKPEWIYRPEYQPWWQYQPTCTCKTGGRIE